MFINFIMNKIHMICNSGRVYVLSLIIFFVTFNNTHAYTTSPNDSVIDKTDTLDEVVVTADMRLFKYSANKFVYNVSADSTLLNTNLINALRRIPILEVGNDNQVSSMDGLAVVYKINGLKDPILSSDVSQVLSAIPSSFVSKVELSKTVDEDKGTVLVLNVVTRSRLEGYRAQISTYLSDQSWRNSVWGMSKIKRFNFSGNYTNTWIYGHNMRSGLNENRIIDDKEYYLQDDSRYSPYKTDLHNVEITASYDTDDSSFLSLYVRGIFKADPHQDFSMSRRVTDKAGNLLLSYDSKNKTRYRDSEYEAVVRWEKIFNKGEHQGYLNVGYEYYNRPTRSKEKRNYDIGLVEDQSMIDDIYDFIHLTKKNYITNTLQADGSYRINRRNQIGLFGKLRFRDESWNNDVEKTFILTPNHPLQSTNSNSNLKEIFGNLFPKYTYFGNRWETTIGVLAQAYRHSVMASGIDYAIKNTRLSILPYIRVAFITRDRLLFELNYEMKSQVPDITALDPYINTDNAGEISYGNPYLKPQESHNLEFRLSKNIRKFYTSGYFSFTSIEDVILSRVFMEDGVVNHTFGNLGINRSYSMGGFTSGRLWPKTFMRFSFGISRIDYRDSSVDIRNSGWQWNVAARCEQELPWNVFLDINANFISSTITLQGRKSSKFNYGLSFYKSLFSGALNLSLEASSFIPIWYKNTSSTSSDNYNSKSWDRVFHAYFGVGISYSFGKLRTNVKQSSFSIDNDEIKKDYDK